MEEVEKVADGFHVIQAYVPNKLIISLPAGALE